MSKGWTSVESAIRKLMYAKSLPGHEYAPRNQVSNSLRVCGLLKYAPRNQVSNSLKVRGLLRKK